MYDIACAYCGPDCGNSKGFVFNSIIHDKQKDIELIKILRKPLYKHLRVNKVFDDLINTHLTTVSDVFHFLVNNIKLNNENGMKYSLFGTFEVDCSVVRNLKELEKMTENGQKMFTFHLNEDKKR